MPLFTETCFQGLPWKNQLTPWRVHRREAALRSAFAQAMQFFRKEIWYVLGADEGHLC